jgi:predicted RND superfamily exporter protein
LRVDGFGTERDPLDPADGKAGISDWGCVSLTTMASTIRFILRHRGFVLGAIAVLLGISVVSAQRLRLQFQFRDFYDYPANPALPDFRQANQDFGDPAGNVVVVLRARDVFAPEVLSYIRKLTSAIEPNPLFVHVHSLSNARALRANGDDVISGPILNQLPQDPAAIATLRRTVLSDPLLVRRLVSPDGTVAAVLAEMRKPATFSSIAEQEGALEAVKKALAATPPPASVTAVITGAPAVEVETTRALIRDQLHLMPGVMFVLFIALFLTFRSKHGVLLAFASVNVATVWTAGFYAMLDRPVDMIGSIIPTSILVYGVVDPIFVLTRYLHKIDDGRSNDDAIVESLSELALPCFLTSLTTALGFLAFATAPAPTVQYYGLTVGVGVLLSWITTMTVLPVLLSFTAPPKRRFSSLRTSETIDRSLRKIWIFTRARVPLVLGITALVLVGGGLIATRQRITAVYVGGLPNGEVRTQAHLLERDLTGVLRFVVYLRGEPDSMRRPDVLAAIEKIDRSMEEIPAVTFSVSLADVVGQANQAFSGGDPAARRVPRSRALIAQYLALLDPQDRSSIVSDDYARTQIAILVRDEGGAAALALADKLAGITRAAGLEAMGVRIALTGNGIVAYRELHKVVVDLVQGFAVAFALVFALQWLMFRSLRVAVISVIPNLIPVVLCFLTLKALALDLRLDSALVLCISIGGLFNTTIHLAARIRQTQRAVKRDPDFIVEKSLRAIGPAALFTSTILSAGFAVLILSSFPGLRTLGLLSMVTMLSAVICDIVISPILFRLFLRWPHPPSLAVSASGVSPSVAPTAAN